MGHDAHRLVVLLTTEEDCTVAKLLYKFFIALIIALLILQLQLLNCAKKQREIVFDKIFSNTRTTYLESKYKAVILAIIIMCQFDMQTTSSHFLTHILNPLKVIRAIIQRHITVIQYHFIYLVMTICEEVSSLIAKGYICPLILFFRVLNRAGILA